MRRKADPRHVYEGLRLWASRRLWVTRRGCQSQGRRRNCGARTWRSSRRPRLRVFRRYGLRGRASRLLPPPPVTLRAVRSYQARHSTAARPVWRQLCRYTVHFRGRIAPFATLTASRRTSSAPHDGLRFEWRRPRPRESPSRPITSRKPGNAPQGENEYYKPRARPRRRTTRSRRDGYWPQGLDEELVEACRGLGLRCLTDTHALWVAKRALQSELPPNWVRSHARTGGPSSTTSCRIRRRGTGPSRRNS